MERLTNSDYHFCANCHNCNDCAHTEDNSFPVCPERARHDRLAIIEDILGDEYDLDLLRELVKAEREDRILVMTEPRQAGAHRIAELAKADREGRCVVLPCKEGDKLNLNGTEFSAYHWSILLTAFSGGKVELLTTQEAEAALRREQE